MSERFRVQIPTRPRRPFLRVAGLARYGELVFDAAAPAALAPPPKKTSEHLPPELVQSFLATGPSARVWLRGRSLDPSAVPKVLYSEMLTLCQVLRPSTEKTLELDLREAADLQALGLTVSRLKKKPEKKGDA